MYCYDMSGKQDASVNHPPFYNSEINPDTHVRDTYGCCPWAGTTAQRGQSLGVGRDDRMRERRECPPASACSPLCTLSQQGAGHAHSLILLFFLPLASHGMQTYRHLGFQTHGHLRIQRPTTHNVWTFVNQVNL